MSKHFPQPLSLAINLSFILSSILMSVISMPAYGAGLTKDDLLNVTAYAEDMTGDGNHPLPFKNGLHNNGSGTDKILHTATGDLNGDGIDDGAIVYYEEWGGTGAFMSMSVFICKDGKAQQVGYRTLGDRSDTKDLKIHKQVLHLDILTHGPNDPAITPTVFKKVKFHLKDNKLVGPENIN